MAENNVMEGGRRRKRSTKRRRRHGSGYSVATPVQTSSGAYMDVRSTDMESGASKHQSGRWQRGSGTKMGHAFVPENSTRGSWRPYLDGADAYYRKGSGPFAVPPLSAGKRRRRRTKRHRRHRK